MTKCAIIPLVKTSVHKLSPIYRNSRVMQKLLFVNFFLVMKSCDLCVLINQTIILPLPNVHLIQHIVKNLSLVNIYQLWTFYRSICYIYGSVRIILTEDEIYGSVRIILTEDEVWGQYNPNRSIYNILTE